MARYTATCAVCGREFVTSNAEARLWCSVACQFEPPEAGAEPQPGDVWECRYSDPRPVRVMEAFTDPEGRRKVRYSFGDSVFAEQIHFFNALYKPLDQLAALRAELQQARATARALAHAYDHDTRPPDWALEAARRWDARGNSKEGTP